MRALDRLRIGQKLTLLGLVVALLFGASFWYAHVKAVPAITETAEDLEKLLLERPAAEEEPPHVQHPVGRLQFALNHVLIVRRPHSSIGRAAAF